MRFLQHKMKLHQEGFRVLDEQKDSLNVDAQ